MGSLYTALNIAIGSLEAQQAGLETTTNNLANMNTPGYSRQRPVLQEADPLIQGRLAFGNGVNLTRIESLRDSLLNVQIAGEMQQQARSQSFVDTMNQVQPLFPMDSSGIGNAISTFFQSLNGLAANPSDSSLRQNVLAAAKRLATAFAQTASQLNTTRSNLDRNVQQDVQEVNQITSQIASLNRRLASTTSSTGSEYGSFLDQRDALVQQLSGLIDVSVLQQGSSLTLTTRQGSALVVDGQNFDLTPRLHPSDGTQHIYAQGGDVTNAILGGKLGGTLEARDQEIPSMLGQLDTLASTLVTKSNDAHALGFDLNGVPGKDLFNPLTGVGAAAGMSVAINDPNLLAASSDGSRGSNGNIANLAVIATQAVSNGMTPIQAYANLVFQVGSSISDASADLTASTNVLQQLQQRQSSVSGVSLDEEASNLLLYERAYQAAARAISTVDQMLQTVINMGAQ